MDVKEEMQVSLTMFIGTNLSSSDLTMPHLIFFTAFFFFGGEMRLSCFKDPEPLIYLLLFLSLVQWTICYS